MKERQWKGKTLRLRDEHAELFDQAAELAKTPGTMAQIVNLLARKESPIYRDALGHRVDGSKAIFLDLYVAVKGMARERGVADGMLRETAECSHPSLDDLRAKN
jgi:hypothetical protein